MLYSSILKAESCASIDLKDEIPVSLDAFENPTTNEEQINSQAFCSNNTKQKLCVLQEVEKTHE